MRLGERGKFARRSFSTLNGDGYTTLSLSLSLSFSSALSFVLHSDVLPAVRPAARIPAPNPDVLLCFFFFSLPPVVCFPWCS